MSEASRRQLLLEPVTADEPVVAAALAALEEGRRRTKRAVYGLTQALLDHSDEHYPNSIATLLYHLALIEADWLYAEVLGVDYPPEVTALFPTDAREDNGRLSPVSGLSLDEHLARLDAVRDRLLAALRPMPLADFRRPRSLPDYDLTPEWVLQHLVQHEAAHRGQITLARARLEPAAL